ADGKVLLGGSFTTLQPNGAASPTTRNRIARVNANGTLDTGFDPKANGAVYSVAVQADGKVLLGGQFTTLQPNGAASPTPRNNFARLFNVPATQTLSAPDTTQALWQRGGAAPELFRAIFEWSTDGGANWIPLGPGTRVGTTANWQRAGLSLTASGSLRARGVTNGGYRNGTSGLIEQVTEFGSDSDNDGLLNSWELTYWPSTVGHDADDDFDHDGLTELEELAFGLNPTIPDVAAAPAVVNEGGFLTITITKRPGATYQVETAGTLLQGQPNSFSAATTAVLINNTTTLKVRDSLPIGSPSSRYLRVKVTAAP
ncbi:MAG: delta-60 repeat domain-containing protein, partial [Chthoniobacteraceae bacterium]